MTQVFDEYGNYIFPSDVPSEPCTATSIPFRDATKEELDYEEYIIIDNYFTNFNLDMVISR